MARELYWKYPSGCHSSFANRLAVKSLGWGCPKRNRTERLKLRE
jgi:hypothetical protein